MVGEFFFFLVWKELRDYLIGFQRGSYSKNFLPFYPVCKITRYKQDWEGRIIPFDWNKKKKGFNSEPRPFFIGKKKFLSTFASENSPDDANKCSFFFLFYLLIFLYVFSCSFSTSFGYLPLIIYFVSFEGKCCLFLPSESSIAVDFFFFFGLVRELYDAFYIT